VLDGVSEVHRDGLFFNTSKRTFLKCQKKMPATVAAIARNVATIHHKYILISLNELDLPSGVGWISKIKIQIRRGSSARGGTDGLA
jgi:hypothetical protein